MGCNRVKNVAVGRWRRTYPAALMALLLVLASGAAAGLGPLASPSTERWQIESEVYYSLPQNPILFAPHSLRDAFLSQWTWAPSRLPQPMNEVEAIETTRLTIGEGRSFPCSDYPLVSLRREADMPYFDRPVNILLIFVEGLDRRYLDRVYPLSGSSQASSVMEQGAPSWVTTGANACAIFSPVSD